MPHIGTVTRHHLGSERTNQEGGVDLCFGRDGGDEGPQEVNEARVEGRVMVVEVGADNVAHALLDARVAVQGLARLVTLNLLTDELRR